MTTSTSTPRHLHITRDGLLADLDTALNNQCNKPELVALVIVDVREFRELNRSFGLQCGDAILAAISSRLNHIGSSSEPFYCHYLGDDEFGFVLPRLKSPGFAVLFAEQLNVLFKDVFEWNRHTFKITVNCGLAYNYDKHHDSAKLLFDTETALVEAKKLNQPYLMLDKNKQQARDQLKWELLNELHEAIEQDELTLFFQPKLSLHDNSTQTCEALVRWPSGERGLIAPDITIPLIEHLGSELDLIKWLVNSSLKQLDKAQQATLDGISINIPASSVTSKELYNVVAEALQRWGTEGRQLTLEITEDVLIKDKELAFDYLSKLRELGVRISIDDFGTGYSSLAYFKHIPADELKIDRSFIQNMLHSDADAKIVRLIIELAHMFELDVVAEGIEDNDTLALLKQLGCDFAQGFVISKPLPLDGYLDWLAQREA